MRRSVTSGLRVLAVLAVLVPLTRVSGTEPAGPEGLVDEFVRAWNTHDMKTFSALLSEDGDWVTVGGKRLRGRDAIKAFLDAEHQAWAKSTSMSSSNVSVRRLDANAAVVLFNWEVTGATDREGKPASPFRGTNILVAMQASGRWTVVAGQATNARSGNPGQGAAQQ